MEELVQFLTIMCKADMDKIVVSKAASKTETFKKIIIEKKSNGYQIAKYTDKQVFHENVKSNELCEKCAELINDRFRQVNGFAKNEEHIILISKKGKCNYQVKKRALDTVAVTSNKAAGNEHNRKKNYILDEGMTIEPLMDMGVLTKDGRIVNSKYDKYRQINRFIEIIDDEVSKIKTDTLNVIDFGCGKSYLTFVVYYYLTEIRKINVNMIGLDLKEDVIVKCNEAAKKYGYTGLHFEMGDINGYKTPFDVDMVITLHACDTATDYALYNAIMWNARMIFSVPCCQHELNSQIKPQDISIMAHYGIIKERFCALATDAIRANLLEYCGYKTQVLEFIDLENTPKNLLIRAVRRPMTPKNSREKLLTEVEKLMKEYAFEPTLYKLLRIGE